LALALPSGPFLYPVLDVGLLGGRAVGTAVAAVAAGGVRIVQFRAKGLPDRRLFTLATEAAAAAREAGVLLVVNDRADVARMLGADGVHVGQDDLPPREVRRLLPSGSILGLSTHGLGQLDAARDEPVDYVAIGPVFPTRTKADPHPVVGLEIVRRARQRTRRPLVAIGGITAENARSVVEAGADGVAVISALLGADDLTEAARTFQARLR